MESIITRATRGGFLVGDYIELISNYKSHQAYKDLHDNVKKDLDSLVDSKLHLRVIGINDTQPQRYGGNPDMITGHVILSLAQDQGGGRRYYNVLVPSCLCVVKSFYPNYAPFPDQFNYDNKEILQPQEVGEVQSGAKGITYSLPTTDTTIPVAKTATKKKKKKKKKKVQKESYTSEYLSGMEYFR
jgi:hypothetical protein